jgi:hypothetical protein
VRTSIVEERKHGADGERIVVGKFRILVSNSWNLSTCSAGETTNYNVIVKSRSRQTCSTKGKDVQTSP